MALLFCLGNPESIYCVLKSRHFRSMKEAQNAYGKIDLKYEFIVVQNFEIRA